MHLAPLFPTSSLKKAQFIIPLFTALSVNFASPYLGDTAQKSMFVWRELYPSVNIGILAVKKVNVKMKELIRIGIDTTEIKFPKLQKSTGLDYKA